MSNLVTRTISGAVFVIIVIGSILLHPLAFAVVFFIIALLGLHEFLTIVGSDESRRFGVSPYILGGYLYLSIAFFALYHYLPARFLLPVLLFNIPLPGFLLLLELYSGNEKPFTRVAKSLLGILYICLPLALLNFLFFPSFLKDPDPVLLVSLFVLIWINDTFAYLIGMSFGRHHLFPAISPKKTWEGSFGGAVFCLLSAFIAARYFPVLTLTEWMIFATAVVIFATLGDLVESMLKRSYQLKDSGNIMPGHGGILDRFDATLGVAPVAFFILLIIWLL